MRTAYVCALCPVSYMYTCTVPGPQVLSPCVLRVQSGEMMTRHAYAVFAWTMLADSDMLPVYTLPLVMCALVMC